MYLHHLLSFYFDLLFLSENVVGGEFCMVFLFFVCLKILVVFFFMLCISLLLNLSIHLLLEGMLGGCGGELSA